MSTPSRPPAAPGETARMAAVRRRLVMRADRPRGRRELGTAAWWPGPCGVAPVPGHAAVVAAPGANAAPVRHPPAS